jgi:hypothetical protein
LPKPVLGASLLLASLVSGAAPRAPALFFEWHAPESCPQQSWLLSEVSRLRGHVDVRPSPDGADVSAAATVSYLASRWTVRVDTQSSPGSGTRTIEAESCLRAAEAAATVVSLALAPFALPPPPRSAAPLEQEPAALEVVAEPPPAPARAWRWSVGASTTMRFGLLPQIVPGAALSAGFARSGFKLELQLHSPAFQSATFPGSTAGGQLSLPFAASLVGCRAVTGEETAELALCVTVDGGVARGQGQNLDVTHDETAPWLSTGALATLRLRLWGPVGARLDAGAGVSWSHPLFAFNLPQGQVTLYQMPWFNTRAALGLELAW